MSAAISAIETILDRGAQKLHEAYLQPKVMPYAAAQVCATYASLSTVSQLAGPVRGRRFSKIIHIAYNC